MSSCFWGEEDDDANASEGRSASSWVGSYALKTRFEIGSLGESSTSIIKAGFSGDLVARDAGLEAMDCLAGNATVLMGLGSGGRWTAMLFGFCHIAPRGFQGGEDS